MADNTTLNSGSGGNTLRTLEDASSIQWPVGVVAYATSVADPDVLTIPTAAALADNTATPTTLLSGSCLMVYDGSTWDMGRGDATNGLLVNLGTNNDVTLATLPDTSAGDLAAINSAVSGTLTVGSHAVTNAGTFAVQLDGTALTRLTDIETNTDFGAVTGGGVEAGALRVTIANDSTGVVSIDDNGGSLTVDGTVTANLSATDNAVLDSIDTAVNGTLTVGSHAVTNAGTFAVQSEGDVAHDSADSGNPVKIGAKVETSTSGATLAADADRTDLYADSDGTLLTRTNHPLADMLSERISDTAGTSAAFTGDFAASGADIKNYVTAITAHNSSGTDGYIDLRDGAAGSVLWTIPIPAGGGVVISNGGHPLFGTTANTALAYDVSAALSTVYLSVSGFKSKV